MSYPKTQERVLSQKTREFLKSHNECCLCGRDDLTICVEYLPHSRFIREKTRCSNCMTTVRVKSHSLQ